jgi:hypothetical protein
MYLYHVEKMLINSRQRLLSCSWIHGEPETLILAMISTGVSGFTLLGRISNGSVFQSMSSSSAIGFSSWHLSINRSSMTQSIFNDSRAGITSVYKMDKGVPQGGSMSSALFNMDQSTSIRRAAQLHPTVSILLIADDTHVLGTPEEVIAAIMTIRDLSCSYDSQ